ncbi:DUF1714-domain-containing protein, partial [Saccharata proteae CBS 121410]
SLKELLAHSLPNGSAFSFYHVSTPPTKCAAIFAAPPAVKPERTYCESHFLNVAIKPDKAESAGSALVYGIEVNIYTTKHLTTIFVSKADSTGYLALLKLPRAQSSPLRSISTTFISWLVKHRQRAGTRLVVSLFARAQDQYLFPGSVDNEDKHIADDTALVKWWCKVLDPILREYAPEDEPIDPEAPQLEEKTTAQGHVIIPGLEKYDTLRFFPPTVQSDPPQRKRWTHGHPLRQISSYPSAPPRCLIPHFPDDPKARYMDELDDELPDGGGGGSMMSPSKGNGCWKSVRSLEQFWDMMAFRQECSSGRLTGFIWVVFTPPDFKEPEGTDVSSSSQMSVAETTASEKAAVGGKRRESMEKAKAPKRKKHKPTDLIVVRKPRAKTASSASSNLPPEVSPYYAWPSASRGQIVLDEKAYKRAIDLLMRQNYAKLRMAVLSTKKWINEVAILGGRKHGWGILVEGKRVADVVKTGGSVGSVNTLLGKKKRKSDEVSDTGSGAKDGVNTLSAGLVRKKRKSIDGEAEATDAGTGVNVLSSGLVRRKPK